MFSGGSLPVVIKLRVSRLRIWVTIINIVACIWVLKKNKTYIHIKNRQVGKSQNQKLMFLSVVIQI